MCRFCWHRIKENMNGKYVIEVVFYPAKTNEVMFDPKFGCMELQAGKYIVQDNIHLDGSNGKTKYFLGNINDNYGLLRLFYLPEEINKFQNGHFKGLALTVIKNKYKNNALKPYHFKDIKMG